MLDVVTIQWATSGRPASGLSTATKISWLLVDEFVQSVLRVPPYPSFTSMGIQSRVGFRRPEAGGQEEPRRIRTGIAKETWSSKRPLRNEVDKQNAGLAFAYPSLDGDAPWDRLLLGCYRECAYTRSRVQRWTSYSPIFASFIASPNERESRHRIWTC